MRLTLRLISVWLVCVSISAIAASAADWVTLSESDDSLCLAHGGQLVSLQLTAAAMADQTGDIEVWVDRWFMQVQTADHTRHVLSAQVPEAELGCSQSMAGPQHWTLSVIKRLP
ncbi:hypothetical protein [Methylophilus sp. 5]|uniref:hypothetical protein n=1 Tax=Methylophilus sp. 5 TaxID=1112274 RepID=UPI00048CD9A0|nr:hypothetical protein [Methylophilus sp. 5]